MSCGSETLLGSLLSWLNDASLCLAVISSLTPPESFFFFFGARKILFKTIEIESRLLQQRREIGFNTLEAKGGGILSSGISWWWHTTDLWVGDWSMWIGHQRLLTVCVCSVLSDSLWPPWTVAHQAPLSIEFSRQEYWSGLPFPTPEDHPNPGIKLMSFVSLASAGRFCITASPGKHHILIHANKGDFL